jgi:hypothetical protein
MKQIALLLVLAACSGRTAPHATAADAQRANVELAELEEGRTLLLRKCGGCHKTPIPNDYSPAEWPKQVDDMAPKAKLDARQHALIEQYLITMSTKP